MKDDKPVKPTSIYLDTDRLRSISPFFVNSTFQEFIRLCQTLKIRVCITEVVYEELHRYCKESIKEKRNKCLDHLKYLEAFECLADPSIINNLTKPKYKVVDILNKQLDKMKITIINTPNRTLKELQEMAVTYDAAFQKEDRGFKDTLTLLSIIGGIGVKSQHSTFSFIVCSILPY